MRSRALGSTMTTTTSDRQLVWVVVAIVAALFVLPVLLMGVWMLVAGPMMGGWDHMMGGTTAGMARVPLAVGLQLVVFALLLGAGYLGYRAVTGTDEATDPALEELRTAYARGELSDEEYERRKDRLE